MRGKASRLEALVGVDDEPKTHPGSVEFLVLGDGKVLWKSGVMKGGQPAKPVNVDLSGVKSLELRVTDGGDGNDSDHADWLNARLVVARSSGTSLPAGQEITGNMEPTIGRAGQAGLPDGGSRHRAFGGFASASPRS